MCLLILYKYIDNSNFRINIDLLIYIFLEYELFCCFIVVGIFVCVYWYYLLDMDWLEKICRYEFYVLLVGVVFEWIFCVVVIFLFLCVYFILYLIVLIFELKFDLNVIM